MKYYYKEDPCGVLSPPGAFSFREHSIYEYILSKTAAKLDILLRTCFTESSEIEGIVYRKRRKDNADL